MKELTKEEILKRELWIKVYVEKIKDGGYGYSDDARDEADKSVFRFDSFFEDDEQ